MVRLATGLLLTLVLQACSADEKAVSFSVSPKSVTMYAGAATAFSGVARNSTKNRITWAVAEKNGGSVDEYGKYTAPDTNGTFHVVATLQSASTSAITASATIEVLPVPRRYCSSRIIAVFTDPGADAAWDTADDVQTKVIQLYVDERNAEKLRADFDGPGADQVWGTADDQQSSSQTWHYLADGKSLDYYTHPASQGTAYVKEQYEYDEGKTSAKLVYTGTKITERFSYSHLPNGSVMETEWGAGGDGVLNTGDDVAAKVSYFFYRQDGQPLKITSDEAGTNVVTQYSYDQYGGLVEIIEGTAREYFEYDNKGYLFSDKTVNREAVSGPGYPDYLDFYTWNGGEFGLMPERVDEWAEGPDNAWGGLDDVQTERAEFHWTCEWRSPLNPRKVPSLF